MIDPRPPGGVQDSDWAQLRVNAARVNQHLADLSRFGRNPQGGVSRLAFSPEDVAGREFVMGLMREAGLDVRIDAAGNILGRREGTGASASPVLFGSHIDSVPEGGNYDGDLGTLAAVEAVHRLQEAGYRNRHPLEVVVWCDEEGGLTGSRAVVGLVSDDELAAPGRDGVPLAEKLRRIGGAPERLAEAQRAPGSVTAYLELHVEQGRILYDDGIQVGVVEGIVGIQQRDVVVEGVPNHAGTTPMDRRSNAMLTAAEVTLAVDRIVKAEPGRQVGTVGRLVVEPGAPNVVPGRVSLTVELRDLDEAKVERLWEAIWAEAQEIAERRQTPARFTLRHTIAPALCHPRVRDVIGQAATRLGLSTLHMPSGAGHDAQSLAHACPVGMIFVPSAEGVSHSPREYTSPEDVTNGANVLLQSVLGLDRE